MRLNKKLLVLFVFAFGLLVSAQSERKITRSGNTQYETGNFVEAEINYKKALEQNPSLLEAQFNLGDALTKQERYEEALASFDLVTQTTEDAELKASAFHNKGNVQLKQQDLEGAVASYEESLRANPKDFQTRYNYAYAKKQLAQQQEQEQEQDQNQEDNKDQEENKDSKDKGDQNKEDSENKDSEDSKEKQEKQDDTKEDSSENEPKDKGETDGQESEDEKKKQEQESKAKENKLSPEEAQRLLDALKQEENKVQAKMKKHKIKGAKVKIEKDW